MMWLELDNGIIYYCHGFSTLHVHDHNAVSVMCMHEAIHSIVHEVLIGLQI